MNNQDNELILALERAKAQLLSRRHNSDSSEEFALAHNIHAANLILGHYQKHRMLEKVQRNLAEKIIERANSKGRIKL